jgi:hypothetical protein
MTIPGDGSAGSAPAQSFMGAFRGETRRPKRSELLASSNDAAVAEQGTNVGPDEATPKKAASQNKGVPKANKSAKKTAPKKEPKRPAA